MIKKVFLTVLAASMFWLMTIDAFAVVQLNDALKPENLPAFETVEAVDSDNPESAATQTLILFVGNIVSQLLLFVGALIIVYLIVAGANYIFAFGKDERIEKGKRGVFWAIMGLLTILLSYAIVQGIIQIILQVDFQAS